MLPSNGLTMLFVAFAAWAFVALASPPKIAHWLRDEPPALKAPILGGQGPLVDQVLCGQQYYHPTEYTCFDNSLLCPWLNGYPMSRCGITDKCFLPFRYDCDNGQLQEIPAVTGPFELVAINIRALAYVKVRECGRNFWLKKGPSCTMCPPSVADACPPGIDTVFNPGSSMNTMVPGGQRYFVDNSTGALQVSTPHSGADPEGAIYDFTALQNGTFGLFPHDSWMACQKPCPGQDGDEPAWQIFATLPGIEIGPECVAINLVTIPWTAPACGSAAAWEYI